MPTLSLPANHSRQPWKTLRCPQPAASRPWLIIQVPSGPRCDWPHRPTKRTGYAPAVSCWARVFQRTLVPGGPFHPPGSRRLPCSKTGLSLSFSIVTTTAVASSPHPHSTYALHKCSVAPFVLFCCWAARGPSPYLFLGHGPGRSIKGPGRVSHQPFRFAATFGAPFLRIEAAAYPSCLTESGSTSAQPQGGHPNRPSDLMHLLIMDPRLH